MFTTFEIFKTHPQVIHAFSTRQGGVSSAPYHSLNLGLHTGDDRQRVQINRRRFFEALDIPTERLVFPQQVHGSRVVAVREAGTVERCDALITDRRHLYLTIQTADCFPVFLFDPRQQVVAVAHSGWRGTAADIAGKTIAAMAGTYGSRAQDILAAVGPGVQQSCYQVDEQVAVQFDARFLTEDGPGHFRLNVQGAIVQQLKMHGIPEAHIEWDGTCTHCAAERYYSYRRDGQSSGRMMGVIGLR